MQVYRIRASSHCALMQRNQYQFEFGRLWWRVILIQKAIFMKKIQAIMLDLLAVILTKAWVKV